MRLPSSIIFDSIQPSKEYLKLFNLDVRDVYLMVDGRIVSDNEDCIPGKVYRLNYRLPGGKGGFGSMLRALGAQIEKTTNREACRDLSGRRIRDVNTEKKLREWAARQEERDAEREKRRKEKRKKIQEPQVSQFVDQEYTEQKQKIKENLEEALKQGLSQPEFSKATVKDHKKMAKSLMSYGVDLLSSSDDGDDDNDGEEDTFEVADNEENGGTSGSHSSEGDDVSARKRQKMSSIEEVDTVVSTSSTSGFDAKKPLNPLGEGSSKDASTVDSEDPAISTKTTDNSNNTTASPTIITTSPKAATATTKAAETTQETKDTPPTIDLNSLDLSAYQSLQQLQSLGLDPLKELLKRRGVKCGGTLVERAERLWTVKDLQDHQIPPQLLAGKSKAKK